MVYCDFATQKVTRISFEELQVNDKVCLLYTSEKDALIADYTRLTEIDGRLCELYNSISVSYTHLHKSI